jgi:hypothetical protein
MNGGYYPQVVNPKVRPQMSDMQPPFFFGGSQVPDDLNLNKNQYSGSGFRKNALCYKNGKICKMYCLKR